MTPWPGCAWFEEREKHVFTQESARLQGLAIRE
jgi:hypothetical protein